MTVSNDAIRGSTPQAAAQVLQWVSFADSEIIPPASAWVFPTLGIMQFNKQVCVFLHDCAFSQMRCVAFGRRDTLMVKHTSQKLTFASACSHQQRFLFLMYISLNFCGP